MLRFLSTTAPTPPWAPGTGVGLIIHWSTRPTKDRASNSWSSRTGRNTAPGTEHNLVVFRYCSAAAILRTATSRPVTPPVISARTCRADGGKPARRAARTDRGNDPQQAGAEKDDTDDSRSDCGELPSASAASLFHADRRSQFETAQGGFTFVRVGRTFWSRSAPTLVPQSTGGSIMNKELDHEPEVHQDLRHIHPLVRATRRILRAAQTDEYGRLIPGPGCLDLLVRRRLLRRASIIADALLRACEAKGWAVSVPTRPLAGTLVAVASTEVPIRISEGLDKLPLSQEARGQSSMGFGPHRIYNRAANGRLILSILWGRGTGARRDWREGKRFRAEDLLSAVQFINLIFGIRRRNIPAPTFDEVVHASLIVDCMMRLHRFRAEFLLRDLASQGCHS